MSAQCGECGDPFTGSPWRYRTGDGVRVHVDCQQAALQLERAIADRDAADAWEDRPHIVLADPLVSTGVRSRGIPARLGPPRPGDTPAYSRAKARAVIRGGEKKRRRRRKRR